MQFKQRGAGSAEREARSQTLNRAGREQPRNGVGEHEHDCRPHQRGESEQQHRAAADLVRNTTRHDQGNEHPTGVGRVNQRQDDGRETPKSLIGAVQRRRDAGREQRQADHGRDQRVCSAGRQGSAQGGRLLGRARLSESTGLALEGFHVDRLFRRVAVGSRP
jgi:hypothetical protein